MELEPLTDREKAMLAFENKWRRHTGQKEGAIIDVFHLRTSRYYQLLNRLIEKPAAMVHDPQLVKRLLNQRAARTTARANAEFRKSA